MMTVSAVAWRSAAIVLLLAAAPIAARPLRSFDALAISPDGARVAAIEAEAEPDAGADAHAAIVVRHATDGAIVERIDPCARCSYAAPAFAGDGRIAFVMRDKAAGVARLMVAAGGRTRELAAVAGLLDRPRWSPDGATIAFLATVGARKEAGAVQAGARQTGEIGASDDEQRIAVVAADGGKPYRLVSPADRYVYEYGWTPDARGFVATTAKGNGDANWWVATIDAISLRGDIRQIARPATQANFPRVSPDGRTVAFIGGLMSDFGSVGGDVWTVPFAGGAPVDATRGFAGSFTSIDWGRGGLVGTALIADRAAVVPIDPQEGARAPLWSASATPSAGDGKAVFAAGQMAAVVQDYEHGPAILAGPVGHPRRITADNDRYPAIVSARSLTWRSDGHEVQGWLLAPKGAEQARAKAPMIVVVHGGPAAASVPTFLWQGTQAALSRRGYWLFYPNPRGSYGQGEAFTAANRRDFGGGDLRDILAGVTAATRAAPIDEARLGLMGGSYGGFMAMWANTQTTRFKAIVASAGLSNWISYYGTNGINTWMLPYFGRSAYDDPKAYWDISAIRTIRQARTPTLVTVGERDIEVPPTQSIEYWNGLKAVGVPTTLVIYPDEGHGIRQPDHAADAARRTVAWFDRYLGAQTR